MDLSLPLIGILGLVGYNLNKNLNSRDYTDKRVKIPLSELPNGDSIYESKTFVRSKDQEQKRLDNFYNGVNNVKNTNEYVVAHRDKINKITSGKVVRFQGEHSSDITKPATKANLVAGGPMFNTSKYFIPESNTKDFKSGETFTNVSELSGAPTDFSHSNQVPFFGSHVKGTNSGATLEKFTGSERVAKTEVGNVTNGMQNIHGQSAFTDSIDADRFSNNLTNVQNNMLPFDQYKIPPIPSEHVRPEFKNVDGLRIKTKPRTEDRARMNGGKAENAMFINNTGSLEDIRKPTSYANGGDRYFVTGNKETRNSYVDNSRVDFRKSRKTQAVESKYNLGGGRDYRAGEINRLTETEGEGGPLAGLFNEGTTKTANKNEWLKSRGSRIAGFDGTGIMGTIAVPAQERESTSRFELNNPYESSNGQRLRFDNDAKTTNKESTIYEYKGTAKSQYAKLPEDRDQFYNAQMKTKESGGRTPGAGNQFSSGSGVEFANISSKLAPQYSRLEAGKENSLLSPTADMLGSQRGVNNSGETDFGSRYVLQKYPN